MKKLLSLLRSIPRLPLVIFSLALVMGTTTLMYGSPVLVVILLCWLVFGATVGKILLAIFVIIALLLWALAFIFTSMLTSLISGKTR